jgi:predicted amidophosphoribosyltransferase
MAKANRLLTHDEVRALFEAKNLAPQKPAVPDAVRAACDHCWHHIPVVGQVCCWCGKPWTSRHGPYAPEGER